MSTYSHGADIYTASLNLQINKNDIIDFSSNINPLGLPQSVETAIMQSIQYASRYPDINCRELTEALSIYEKVDKNYIFCSNGAAESIFRIAIMRKYGQALLTSPTFGEYEQALKIGNCNINYYDLKEENNFEVKEDIINHISNETDILFICNPNNPTGQITQKNLLEKIISHCKSTDTIVIIDECFIDFVLDKDKYSVTCMMSQYDNLIILKAFTKIYAMAGIRLGYCMSSNEKIIKKLKISGPPWNVSSIAQSAGVQALKEVHYVEETVEYINVQRLYMMREFTNLGIKTYQSYANYIMFRITENIDLKGELLRYNILIRSCLNYNNLGCQYYRVAIKSEEDNKVLMETLREVLKQVRKSKKF